MGCTEEQLESYITVIMYQFLTVSTALSCQDPSYNYAQPMPLTGHIAQEITHFKFDA